MKIYKQLFSSHKAAQILASRANNRLKAAYAEKSWQAYQHMFKMFMSFCFFLSEDVNMCNVNTILMYIEFLIFNNLSYSSILNHISGVRNQMKWFGLSDHCFDHHKVKLITRAAGKTIQRPPKVKGLFDLETLKHIIVITSKLPNPPVFSTVYLLFLVSSESPT